MVDITSVTHLTLPRKDDVDSGPLSTGGDFKFGYETIKALYVWILCMNSLIIKHGNSKNKYFLYHRFPVMVYGD